MTPAKASAKYVSERKHRESKSSIATIPSVKATPTASTLASRRSPGATKSAALSTKNAKDFNSTMRLSSTGKEPGAMLKDISKKWRISPEDFVAELIQGTYSNKKKRRQE